MVGLIGYVYELLARGIQLYQILLIIYILMSWVPSMRENAFGQFLGKIAEPYLGVFRRFIPPLGMIDISPIIAIYALNLINRGVYQVFSIIQSSLM